MGRRVRGAVCEGSQGVKDTGTEIGKKGKNIKKGRV